MKLFPVLAVLFIIITAVAGQCGVAPAGQGSKSEISITDPYALPALAGGNGVVYLELGNGGRSPDTLLKVESQAAQVAELHETKIDENDVMQMGPLATIEVPAGGSVSLEPGGKHIMFIKLKQALKPAEKISLTLVFEKAGSMTVEAEVREAGPAGHSTH
jgi:copper(I)-binding protein